jgi:oxaloacetate decarboxylase beta subunit
MEVIQNILTYLHSTAVFHGSLGNIAMMIIGGVFIYLGISRGFEPLLLVPIGFGMILGNMPYEPAALLGVYDGPYFRPELEGGSVMYYLYWGVISGVYPPLIFLGVGAMTDFSSLIAQPRLMLLGAAAQVGIFITFIMVILIGIYLPGVGMGLDPDLGVTTSDRLRRVAGAVGIIGGADGPTAIFITSQLAPDLLGIIAVCAYSYMALVPVIQPPIMRWLTTPEERLRRMPPPPSPTRLQRILFPIMGFLVTVAIAPDALPLLGLLFFGNLLKESGVTERLARTARDPFIDSVTILLGVTVGASTQASTFLSGRSVFIFVLGAVAFAIGTAAGVLFAKLLNMFLKDDEKINPLIGSAGVSAVPNAARVSHVVAQQEDPQNFLIMHAMAPNVAGVIGSAVAAGVLLATFRRTELGEGEEVGIYNFLHSVPEALQTAAQTLIGFF